MTLIYRCSILAIYPELREHNAQISSTIEEMSALNHLLGHDSLHYESTKHWLLDWEGEGFSEELAKLIKNN